MRMSGKRQPSQPTVAVRRSVILSSLGREVVRAWSSGLAASVICGCLPPGLKIRLDVLTPVRHVDIAAGVLALGEAHLAELVTHAYVLARLDDGLHELRRYEEHAGWRAEHDVAR